MKDHFVMLWGDMLASSIIEEDVHVKWAFVVCLLLCDADGEFRSTPGYLARSAGMSLEDAEDALKVLSSPDGYSTSKEEEGRRLISTGSNQWRVVNYGSYRQRYMKEKALARDRQRKRDERGRVRTDSDKVGQDGTGSDPCTCTSTCTCTSKKKDGECEGKEKQKGAIPFEEFWTPMIRKEGKKKAKSAWRNLTVKDQRAAMAVLPDHLVRWSGKELRYIPLPATWINGRRWEDELKEKKAGLQHVGAHGEWMYETIRRADYENHGNHSMWEKYSEAAVAWDPRTAPTFQDWLNEAMGPEE